MDYRSFHVERKQRAISFWKVSHPCLPHQNPQLAATAAVSNSARTARSQHDRQRENPADPACMSSRNNKDKLNGCQRHGICSAADPNVRLAGGTLQCCYANAHAPWQRRPSRPLAKVSAASAGVRLQLACWHLFSALPSHHTHPLQLLIVTCRGSSEH
jgi:hypothetical protein